MIPWEQVSVKFESGDKLLMAWFTDEYVSQGLNELNEWWMNSLWLEKSGYYFKDAICRYIFMMNTLHAQWRHQMETLSTLLALSEGKPPVTGGFPSQRPVMQSFDVFFNLHLDKWLS